MTYDRLKLRWFRPAIFQRNIWRKRIKMSKTLEIRISDEAFAKLEQIAVSSALSTCEVAEKLVQAELLKNQAALAGSKPMDFESALDYSLGKNEELLRRLAK
jgi:hypothetical protein